MSSDPQAFLKDFEQNMERLNSLKSTVQQNIKFRQQFTDNLTSRLGEISESIKKLTGLIQTLKTKTDELTTQMNNNASAINSKDKEFQDLRTQIQQLSAEKSALEASAQKQQQDIQNIQSQMQSQIDSCESTLRDIKQKYDTQTTELNALRQEMQQKGDNQSMAHAEELTKMTNQAQQQLKQQEEQLLQKINDCEQRIQQATQDAQSKTAELTQKQQAIDAANTQAQSLQQEIEQLKTTNNMLMTRLSEATVAIKDASDAIQSLTNAAPNAQTKEDVDALLNVITKEVEDAIQNIMNAAQGNQHNYPIPDNTIIRVPKIGENAPVDMTYSDLVNKMHEKVNTLKGNSNYDKYYKAYIQIRKAKTAADVENALRQNNIDLKNSSILGGRRSRRRTRKQKGGFTYKSKSKRKSTTIKTNFKRATAKNSTRIIKG